MLLGLGLRLDTKATTSAAGPHYPIGLCVSLICAYFALRSRLEAGMVSDNPHISERGSCSTNAELSGPTIPGDGLKSDTANGK